MQPIFWFTILLAFTSTTCFFDEIFGRGGDGSESHSKENEVSNEEEEESFTEELLYPLEERIIRNAERFFPDQWMDPAAAIPKETRKCMMEVGMRTWKSARQTSIKDLEKELKKRCPNGFDKVEALKRTVLEDFGRLAPSVRKLAKKITDDMLTNGFNINPKTMEKYIEESNKFTKADREQGAEVFPKMAFVNEEPYRSAIRADMKKLKNGLPGLIQLSKDMEKYGEENPIESEPNPAFKKAIRQDFASAIEISEGELGSSFVSAISSPFKMIKNMFGGGD